MQLTDDERIADLLGFDPPTNGLPAEISFSRCDSTKDASVTRMTWPLSRFKQLLMQHKQGLKAGKSWLPAIFRKNRRSNANAQVIAVAALDLDEGQTFEEVVETIKAANLAAIIATSHSHTIDTPSMRVVFFPRNPWRVADYSSPPAAERAYKKGLLALADRLGFTVDHSAIDPARLFFLPRHAPGAPHESIWIDGNTVDVWSVSENSDDAAQLPDERAARKPIPPEIVLGISENSDDATQLPAERAAREPIPPEIVLGALASIVNDERFDRPQWVRVIAAIRHALGEEGREAAEEWSASWTGGEHDPAKFDRAWRSLRDRGDSDAGAGTILFLARRDGWTDPRERDRLLALCEDLPPDESELFGAPMMRRGRPLINQHNAIVYLSLALDSVLPGLRLNEMTGLVEWQSGTMTEAALVITRVALEKLGLETIRKELVADAVTAVARHRQYHPIRDWLNRLKHDGSLRLDTWLIRCAAAPDTDYLRRVGRAFFIQMVARVMTPGAKADSVLVLHGPQGIGKSTLCRALAGPDYFSDTMPPINGGRDTMLHLRGKWLIELSELAPSRRSEAEDLKAFLTATADTYRAPYARIEETHPRQCVFVGTTNNNSFLRDETGNRRFWPIECKGTLDTDWLIAERDQLFAEAVMAWRRGEIWWLPREFEAAHAAPIQEAARERDPWEAVVRDWLDKLVTDDFGTMTNRRMVATIAEVLLEVLGIEVRFQTVALQRRAAGAIRAAGWHKVKSNGRMVWRRPEDDDDWRRLI